ncbi:hypothetical protein J4Q44_G00377640 [Coregonus suidteri]|uniref:Uncharacterized protein n=1 Tax=Coregonus suidteri TaxID=861788 RepID=A0AAN8Q526_9TELE
MTTGNQGEEFGSRKGKRQRAERHAIYSDRKASRVGDAKSEQRTRHHGHKGKGISGERTTRTESDSYREELQQDPQGKEAKFTYSASVEDVTRGTLIAGKILQLSFN